MRSSLRFLAIGAALASAAGACKPRTSEYTFPEDYTAAFCAKAQTCLWPGLPNDPDECADVMLPAIEALADECPSFSLSQARNCLADVRRMSCDEAARYQDVYQDPTVCDAVYNCYASSY